ncbi:hypothetical protein FISHEDRAFT_60549 [Fistulina hepatica ATCC 64428]|uniref:Uncharacterized protein n=1 Tax=Fistulina hepatica ATCC 64428 TaxID=1128425 RepID=A0A0D7A805_9AGAR|nr:hypothetical protein FISHEDRAFT_60549 [Fistulina hepatica ATCC 64428]
MSCAMPLVAPSDATDNSPCFDVLTSISIALGEIQEPEWRSVHHREPSPAGSAPSTTPTTDNSSPYLSTPECLSHALGSDSPQADNACKNEVVHVIVNERTVPNNSPRSSGQSRTGDRPDFHSPEAATAMKYMLYDCHPVEADYVLKLSRFIANFIAMHLFYVDPCSELADEMVLGIVRVLCGLCGRYDEAFFALYYVCRLYPYSVIDFYQTAKIDEEEGRNPMHSLATFCVALFAVAQLFATSWFNDYELDVKHLFELDPAIARSWMRHGLIVLDHSVYMSEARTAAWLWQLRYGFDVAEDCEDEFPAWMASEMFPLSIKIRLGQLLQAYPRERYWPGDLGMAIPEAPQVMHYELVHALVDHVAPVVFAEDPDLPPYVECLMPPLPLVAVDHLQPIGYEEDEVVGSLVKPFLNGRIDIIHHSNDEASAEGGSNAGLSSKDVLNATESSSSSSEPSFLDPDAPDAPPYIADSPDVNVPNVPKQVGQPSRWYLNTRGSLTGVGNWSCVGGAVPSLYGGSVWHHDLA